jgi:hypothetical protein
MAITHQYQGQLRRLQLVILAGFIVAIAFVSLAWHHASSSSTKDAVAKVVTTYVAHAGYARDLYTVQVTTSSSWPTWALFWERATRKGAATFQDTYGIAEKVKGDWKMIEWGTATVGCRQGPHNAPLPALAMKDLGMACPRGWN